MILRDLINNGKSIINGNIVDSNLILKILVEYFFKIKRDKIVVNLDEVVDEENAIKFIDAVEKINKGIPVQYITNNQEFMKLNFYVDENVLIPQPDTEILVEEVINRYSEKECKILDLCTGSGAIGISLAKYISNCKVVASDISTKAIQIAKLNAEKNLVNKKMEFVESDMFENIKYTDFDIIVSNPPYIERDEIKKLDLQVQNEPFIALDGGYDGLDFYRIIAKEAPKFLKESGRLFLEIGYNQKNSVIELLNNTGKYKEIIAKRDLGNNDRVIVGKI